MNLEQATNQGIILYYRERSDVLGNSSLKVQNLTGAYFQIYPDSTSLVQGVFFNWAYPLDWPPPKMPRLAPP